MKISKQVQIASVSEKQKKHLIGLKVQSTNTLKLTIMP